MLNNIFNFENTYMNLPSEFYSYVKPKKVISPKLAIFNDDLCKELGLIFHHLVLRIYQTYFVETQFQMDPHLLHKLMPVTNLDILQCWAMEERFY